MTAQRKFLRDAGVDAATAVAELDLALSVVRRDIATLGMIRRIAMCKCTQETSERFKSCGQTLLHDLSNIAGGPSPSTPVGKRQAEGARPPLP